MIEIETPNTIIGDVRAFAIGYMFPVDPQSEYVADRHDTRMTMYIGGVNVLGFVTEMVEPPVHGTLQWNLDEAVEWLDEFARNSRAEEFPFPNVPGTCLAELDENARDFDCEDENEFDCYYDALDDYVWPRSWHHTCDEAVFARLYFRILGGNVEISWDNRGAEEGVTFDTLTGHALVPLATFRDVVSRFVAAYLKHWGGYAWDQSA